MEEKKESIFDNNTSGYKINLSEKLIISELDEKSLAKAVKKAIWDDSIP